MSRKERCAGLIPHAKSTLLRSLMPHVAYAVISPTASEPGLANCCCRYQLLLAELPPPRLLQSARAGECAPAPVTTPPKDVTANELCSLLFFFSRLPVVPPPFSCQRCRHGGQRGRRHRQHDLHSVRRLVEFAESNVRNHSQSAAAAPAPDWYEATPRHSCHSLTSLAPPRHRSKNHLQGKKHQAAAAKKAGGGASGPPAGSPVAAAAAAAPEGGDQQDGQGAPPQGGATAGAAENPQQPAGGAPPSAEEVWGRVRELQCDCPADVSSFA